MADAGAAVNVVGVEHPAGELLHHVVGFIPGAAGRARGHDGARAIVGLDFAQAAGGIADGLLPGDRHKLAAFLVADHRLGEARRQQPGIVEKIPAVIAFQAQLILVGDALRAFGTNNFIVIDDKF
ncbi:Uncharacterised protein [Leclercia adecarboxylata]|uniref:Uncharacterized protein n=1 Tax=Leclercia adecarboxylata TaxID=83655 RepID=A0A4U9IK94_9ENTR|nr:Uncharacterised protein [Leclercia adecarboxylata]